MRQGDFELAKDLSDLAVTIMGDQYWPMVNLVIIHAMLGLLDVAQALLVEDGSKILSNGITVSDGVLQELEELEELEANGICVDAANQMEGSYQQFGAAA
ncbi:hypothetical protein [Halocynthiibacter sp.]|uniref:hypothetical protein n=1 Tax=Halocynthiibacter sp. TaxID=1979210 RepID=UPI003C57C773